MVNEHRELKEMISTSEQYRDAMISLLKMDLDTNWGLKYENIEPIKNLKVVDILCMSEGDIKDEYFHDITYEENTTIDINSIIHEKYTDEIKDKLKSRIESELFAQGGNDHFPDVTNMVFDDILNVGDTVRNKLILLAILRMEFDTLLDMENTLEEAKIQLEESIQETADYINSDEYKAKKDEMYNKLVEDYSVEMNPMKKRRMKEVIDAMHSIKSLSFITDRIYKYGEQEIESIMVSFLDKSKSDYLFNKYKAKIKQLKIAELKDIHLTFINIEVNCLDEKYHALNNLFLFVVMRFIAYCDLSHKNEVMYVNRILILMNKLLGNRLATSEREQFISTIEHILDKFLPFEDIFERENITSYKNLLHANKDLIDETAKEILENIDDAENVVE